MTSFIICIKSINFFAIKTFYFRLFKSRPDTTLIFLFLKCVKRMRQTKFSCSQSVTRSLYLLTFTKTINYISHNASRHPTLIFFSLLYFQKCTIKKISSFHIYIYIRTHVLETPFHQNDLQFDLLGSVWTFQVLIFVILQPLGRLLKRSFFIHTSGWWLNSEYIQELFG